MGWGPSSKNGAILQSCSSLPPMRAPSPASDLQGPSGLGGVCGGCCCPPHIIRAHASFNRYSPNSSKQNCPRWESSAPQVCASNALWTTWSRHPGRRMQLFADLHHHWPTTVAVHAHKKAEAEVRLYRYNKRHDEASQGVSVGCWSLSFFLNVLSIGGRLQVIHKPSI